MRFLIVCLLSVFLISSVHAAPLLDSRNTALVLYADKDAVVPGQALTLAVEETIREHWHTYWENPGDSGDTLRLKWTLPEGFSAGAAQFPTPMRLPYAGLLNFGYQNSAVVLVPLTVPDTVAGSEVTLKVRAEILVCEEICIPEFEEMSLTLPVAETANAANAELFDAARAAMPQASETAASFKKDEDNFVLRAATGDFTAVSVFPAEWGLIENASDQIVTREGDDTVITVKAGTRNAAKLDNVRFVLRDENGKGLDVTAKQTDVPVAAAEKPAVPAQPAIGLWQAVLFALLGGLILNLMPCVFPILSMKALSLVKLSTAEQAHARGEAIAYTAGILISFAALAAGLLALKGAGSAVGWGFQLQSPVVVTILVWVMVAVALNLLGVFTVNTFVRFGDKMLHHSGWTGAFFTGVLATVVATPCTAPFMASALGAALVQPWYAAIGIFLSLGFGLALPFLVLAFVPALAKALPRPGAWMETFRQFLAFPMFAAAIWLAWVAASQTGIDGLPYIAGGALLVGFTVWALGTKTLLGRIAGIVSGVLLIWILCSLPMTKPEAEHPIEAFTPQNLEAALATGNPVVVNMTAKWCVTCLVNERAALAVPETQKLFAEQKVAYLKGDWTFADPDITKYLADHGRQGVPLYVVYKDGKETVLPQLLTPAVVAEALKD